MIDIEAIKKAMDLSKKLNDILLDINSMVALSSSHKASESGIFAYSNSLSDMSSRVNQGLGDIDNALQNMK